MHKGHNYLAIRTRDEHGSGSADYQDICMIFDNDADSIEDESGLISRTRRELTTPAPRADSATSDSSSGTRIPGSPAPGY